jgi:HAMP domain-containing protein
VGTEVMAHRVANGDVGSIRTFLAQAKPVMALIPILYVRGLAFGLAAGPVGAFDMFATWLLLAYALFFLTFVLHRTIGARTGLTSSAVGHLATVVPDVPRAEIGAVAGALHGGDHRLVLDVDV